MKLNRRRLRRLIKEEYRKVMNEMYMGGRDYGHMYSGGHMGMAPLSPEPGSHEDELCGNAMQAAILECARNGIRSYDEAGVKQCCAKACAMYNVSEYTDHVSQSRS